MLAATCRVHQTKIIVRKRVTMTPKVIAVGNDQEGKTSMITRFAKGVFTNEYKMTPTISINICDREYMLKKNERTASDANT